MAAGFAGVASTEGGGFGRAQVVLGRMARLGGEAARPARVVPACAFGPGESELAEAEEGTDALLVTGYVRDGAQVLDAAELLARWRRCGADLLRRLSGEFALAGDLV